jgi:pyrrolidone-carboxylate peptidase
MATETLTNQINSTIHIDDLRAMISRLAQTEQGDPLANAMKDLKKALLENPDAAAMLIPEEIGAAVAALRKMTRTEVSEAAVTKAGKARGKKDMTAEELAELDDKLFD